MDSIYKFLEHERYHVFSIYKQTFNLKILTTLRFSWLRYTVHKPVIELD